MSFHSQRVYIIDDDNSFRKSLEELVSLMGYQVSGFASAEDFLKHYPVLRPACLLLDVYLPGLDGFSLQNDLLRRDVNIPIIFITGHGDVPMSVKAIKQGAENFLLKPFNSKDLRSSIAAALGRDTQNVMDAAQRGMILARIGSLTPRENEVMHEVITGKLNKQIATTLGAAEKTIRKHRGCVMKKMQVTSVADLVRALQTVGIVHSSLQVL
ncbi:MAG: response regulator transcription factor [Candidatus Omnitrophica bacterium]|nr:response regulator transcription factor [Candidatus Omnitrophota bacterium]